MVPGLFPVPLSLGVDALRGNTYRVVCHNFGCTPSYAAMRVVRSVTPLELSIVIGPPINSPTFPLCASRVVSSPHLAFLT